MRSVISRLLLAILIVQSVSVAGGKVVSPTISAVKTIPQLPINPWYLGVGVNWAQFSKSSGSCQYEDVTYGLLIRGGYDFNQYIGLEARFLKTFFDKGPFGGVPLQHMGLYVKPQYPLYEKMNFYGLVGYGYTKSLGTGTRLNYFNDDRGLSLGVGFEYQLKQKKELFLQGTLPESFSKEEKKGWTLFVDYQRLLVKEDAPDMNVLSLGIRYDF
jgi:OOP family OmpA-OmpF porin